MSFSRRLAAGITTVGASVLIVLAPSGALAATAADATAVTATDISAVTAADVTTVVAADAAAAPAAAAPAVPALVDKVVVLTPTTEPQRGGAGYGSTVQEAPGGEVSPAAGMAPATTPAAPPTATATPTRGGPGYTTPPTSTPPTTTPPTTTPPTTTPPATTPPASPSVTPGTPGGIAGSKTPTGVKSATAKVKKPKSPAPAGLKDAALPVTGPTLNGTLAAGGLLVAAGALTVWFTRRRRDA